MSHKALLVGSKTLFVTENDEPLEVKQFESVRDLRDEVKSLNHRGLISSKRCNELLHQIEAHNRHTEPNMQKR